MIADIAKRLRDIVGNSELTEDRTIKTKIGDSEITISFTESEAERISNYSSEKSNLTSGSENWSVYSNQLAEYRIRPLAIKNMVPGTFSGAVGDNAKWRIGNASHLWQYSFFFGDMYPDYFKKVFADRLGTRLIKNFNISELLFKPKTLEISSSPIHLFFSQEYVQKMADATLFVLAKETGNCFEFAVPFAPSKARFDRELTAPDGLRIPAVSYHQDTLKYYRIGKSNGLPSHRFLGFYQTVEYYFSRVIDEVLHMRLKTKLLNPSFICDEKNLNEVINCINTHSSEMDELEMLKSVLKKFINESDLCSMISRYEGARGEKSVTKKVKVFGQEIFIDPNPGHVIGTAAKSFKIIRNSIVHANDRYEHFERHIPGTSTELIIANYLPVLEYVAETIILSNAKSGF